MKRKTLTKIMSIFAVVMSFVFSFGLVGCSDDVEPTTPYPIKNFVNFVARIQTPISLDSQGDIEAGYIIYEHLKDTYKNNKDVKGSKRVLDEYKSRFDVLKEAQDRLDAEALQATYRSRFKRAVERIPDEDSLTLKDRAAIDAALALYENLDEESREMSEMAVAYTTLQLADQIVKELEYEDWLEKTRAQAEKFAEDVDVLVEEEISLESAETIEDLQYAYKNLPDEAKKFENVIDAKQKLDKATSEYQSLKDEADVKDFLSRINDLPDAESVTLDYDRDIHNAENVYERMSETAKDADGVAEAYKKLQAVRAQYDVIFAAAEKIKIQEFIKAANDVRTDIENVQITWFDALENASDKYWELSEASQELPEVKEAFDRWNTAQKAFDKKGYVRLPAPNVAMQFSGDTPPHLLFGSPDSANTMLKNYRDFYGVSSNAELDTKVDLMVKVYIDFKYVNEFSINTTDIQSNPGHIVFGSVIRNGLIALSAKDNRIVSGANYSFTCYFADKGNDYIRSNESPMTSAWGKPISSNNYIW